MTAYSPKKSYRQPITVSLFLLACGLICTLYIIFGDKYGFLYLYPSYIIAPLCLAAVFYISTKYLPTEYEYTLYEEADFPSCLFVISKYTFGNKSTVLTVPLCDIKRIYRNRNRDASAVHDYRSNMFTADTLLLEYNFNGKTQTAKIELSSEAISEFSSVIGNNNENFVNLTENN